MPTIIVGFRTISSTQPTATATSSPESLFSWRRILAGCQAGILNLPVYSISIEPAQIHPFGFAT